jgi:hypothetical protein
MNHFYVYAYLRHDGSPYYIGKGKDKRAWKKGKDEIGKPIDISRIVILQENLSDDEAKEHEINLIKIYGRIDLGNGILRNKTDGGDGACLIGEQNGMFGRTKEKHHAYGKKRPDMTGEHNPMHGKKREEHPAYGYKHTTESRDAIQLSKLGVKRINFDQSGTKNPMYGKTGSDNPNFGKKHPKKKCSDCGTLASAGMFNRWHLNGKCKNKNIKGNK